MIKFDEKEAARLAKNVLRNYQEQKRRYLQLQPSQMQSPVITDMPRGGSKKSDLFEAWLDTGLEVLEIERAVNSVKAYGYNYHLLLKNRFIDSSFNRGRVYYENKAGYSSSQYDRQLNKALVMFAESYRGGKIIKEIYKSMVS